MAALLSPVMPVSMPGPVSAATGQTKRPTLTTAPLGDLTAPAQEAAPSDTPSGSGSSDPAAKKPESTSDVHPDLTLPITLSHAISFLTSSLSLPAPTLSALRTALISHLTPKLAATWDPLRPSAGSAIRSLIALPGTLPPPLLAAAQEAGVDVRKWAGGISETGEWEMWIDPGSVCWRDGGWMWCEEGFEWRTYKQTLHTVWQTPLTLAPTTPFAPTTRTNAPSTLPNNLRAPTSTPTSNNPLAAGVTTQPQPPRSHAIPIRAPAVFRIPPTPLPPTVEMGGLSLLDGGREAREALVGEMMACPPSPGAFKRLPLPAQGDTGADREKAQGPTVLGSRSKLLPAVEINGLVAKKPAGVLKPATVNANGTSVWAAPSSATASNAAPAPRRSTSPMSSAGSQAGTSDADSNVRAASSNRSVSSTGPVILSSRPGSRNVSGSSTASSGSIAQPHTPDLASGAFPNLGASTGKSTPQASTVTGASNTPTPGALAAGTGAVRGRAPGPGATGLAVAVQPYDGGNVGVLGGGVKLGGAGAPRTTPGHKNKFPGSSTPAAAPGAYPDRGASPAGYTQDDLAMPDQPGQAGPQRGTATSPARPVKRRRGKPQARPWLPKSHTSFVGAIAMGAPGVVVGPPHVQAFPPNHIRGMSPIGSGYPGLASAMSSAPSVPLPPPALGAPGIWGSPTVPPMAHASGFPSTGGFPSPAAHPTGHRQASTGSPHEWTRAAPFVPGTPGRN